MNDLLYQAFLDWLRRRDVVTLRLETGEVLATGHRPRTTFESFDARERTMKSRHRIYARSLTVVRREHGSAAVDEFLALATQRDRAWRELDVAAWWSKQWSRVLMHEPRAARILRHHGRACARFRCATDMLREMHT